MPKNIVLCSDGTGNLGGTTPDTNVYRMYHAVDLGSKDHVQLAYYANGVGTNSNKYIRALSGAFGLGFERNMVDMYAYLARHYHAGDSIFLFGFSRGAATSRALGGMLNKVGLIDHRECLATDGYIDETLFNTRIGEALKAYQNWRAEPRVAENFKASHSVDGVSPPVKMLGVWDTVSALGFPQEWSFTLDWTFRALDCLSDLAFPHNYYDFQGDAFIENCYHAIAIDDERKTFHPKIWDEAAEGRPRHIEQVWFAGMHSNVGGGYGRAGLSYLTCDWMMKKAMAHGLVLCREDCRNAEIEGNVYGKMHDSREGFGVYYRFAPRDMVMLNCKADKEPGSSRSSFRRCMKQFDRFRAQRSRLTGPIKIHRSVIERMALKTNGYATGFLPYEIEIVSDGADSKIVTVAPRKEAWKANIEAVRKIANQRRRLYHYFVETTLVLLLFVIWFWVYPQKPAFASSGGMMTQIANFLIGITPGFCSGAITFVFKVWPATLVVLAAAIAVYVVHRGRLRARAEEAANAVRKTFLSTNPQR